MRKKRSDDNNDARLTHAATHGSTTRCCYVDAGRKEGEREQKVSA
jgi:hypothetical protein